MAITFRQYLLENNEKPKVSLVNYRRPPSRKGSRFLGLDQHHHTFEVTHLNLSEPLRVYVVHEHNKTDGRIDISDREGNLYDKLGDLGHRNVAHILGRIKHHLPHLETLSGQRVTGARRGIDTEKQHTKMSIKHIKPIAE